MMQPLAADCDGVIRFKRNQIVRDLLDGAVRDINGIVERGYSQEDRDQFFQLIGYSVCGYCDLSFVSDESKDAAWDLMEAMDGATEESHEPPLPQL